MARSRHDCRPFPRVFPAPHPPGDGMSMRKVFPSAEAALRDIVADGQTLAVGGFGL